MNKVLRYNDVEVTINWQSSKTRKRIVEIFQKAEEKCREITSKNAFSGSIEQMEKVEGIYRGAFEELFGKEKSDALFPEDTGVDEYFKFIDLMIALKEAQDKTLDDYSRKFATISSVE